MKKKTAWSDTSTVIDILFDEISQIYVVGGNVCVHIGSECGSESGTRVLKTEKARLIIPKESMGSIVRDISKGLAMIEPESEKNTEELTEGNNFRLGDSFPVTD